MNKKKIIILAVTIITVIVTALILIINKNKKIDISNEDGIKFKNEYSALNNKLTSDNKKYPEINISADNNIKYITIEETLNILDNGTAAIYIGYAECLYCRSTVEVLVETAIESKLDSVYYLDISNIWDIKEVNDEGKVITTKEANSNYNKLLEKIGDKFLENYIIKDKRGYKIDTNSKRLKVPLVLFIVNGEIISHWSGTVFSQNDPYTKLTESQIKGLSKIYSSGLNDVTIALKEQNN